AIDARLCFWQSHAVQTCSSPTYHAFHHLSSRVCSSSKPRNFNPVPKQDSHHPCLELNENSRGSRSGKLRLHTGQARLVDNTCTEPSADSAERLPRAPVSVAKT